MNSLLTRAAAATLLCALSSWAQSPAGPVSLKGYDPGAMDKSVAPCQNFYQYACGLWMKNNPLPSDQSRWDRFDELQEKNRTALHSILEKAATTKDTRSPVEQRIGDMYASCMDEKTIEANGTKPIDADLKRIAAMTNKTRLAMELALLHGRGIPAFFGFGSGQDAKNSSEVIAQLSQGGLSLPDRDYYTRTDAKSKETRDRFVAHMTKMFTLLGHPPAKAAAEAKAVMAIETALANVSLDRVALRNPNNRYHRMAAKELDTLAPAFNWKLYLQARGVNIQELNVAVPDFVKGLNALLVKTSSDDIKTYLSWHVLNDAAPTLAKKFEDEDFDFNSRFLRGQQEQKPRWNRCVRMVDENLGEALGQKYVEQYFSADARQRTLQMVQEIEAEMQKDIESLDWMSAETKKQALAKLALVANKIGYPETWRDYSSVVIDKTDLTGNTQRATAFEVQRRLAKIGKPVDKKEWSMTPPTVNAYYSPPVNNINFPAGILQPPFYYREGDDASNYGAIGVVVGHELTHGFDDSGRQYDGNGNVKEWWTPEDAAKFKERAECIVNEYGSFVATGDVKLNGRLTLGENAADNGGARLAFRALLDHMLKNELPEIDGFTPQQRFFIAYAQIWCQNITDQNSVYRAQTDPHSPGRYRVNGVLQNMPEFQQTFGCKTGDPMVSPNACRVW